MPKKSTKEDKAEVMHICNSQGHTLCGLYVGIDGIPAQQNVPFPQATTLPFCPQCIARWAHDMTSEGENHD